MIGLGTRPVFDYIVRPFVENSRGIFYTSERQVEPYEKSKWPSFNKDKWLSSKTP